MMVAKNMLHKITILITGLAIMFLALPVNGNEKPSNDSLNVARLAGLCRLWGTAAYFHPYLAYKDIDWDQALLKTIPKVIAAKSPDDYSRAIDFLLSQLKDPNTALRDRSLPYTPAVISDIETDQPYLVWTEDSIAVIVITDYQECAESWRIWRLKDMLVKAQSGRGIIFDVRCLTSLDQTPKPDEAAAKVYDLVTRAIQTILKHDIVTPTTRRLIYTSEKTSDPSRASFEYRPGERIAAEGKDVDSLPIVFVMNEGSEIFLPLVGALQNARRGYFIYEGYFNRELGIETYAEHLPDDVIVDIRLNELIKPDGSEGNHPDYVLPYVTDTTLLASPMIKTAQDMINGLREIPPPIGQMLSPSPRARNASSYPEKPSMGLHFLPDFHVWNHLRLFYPSLDVYVENWDTVLCRSLSIILSGKGGGSLGSMSQMINDPQARFGRQDITNVKIPFRGLLLSDSIGYIRPVGSRQNKIDSILPIFAGRPALIVDLRIPGYAIAMARVLQMEQGIDNSFPGDFASYFVEAPTPGAIRRIAQLSSPDSRVTSYREVTHVVYPNKTMVYKGKVVVLIDQSTVGEAEAAALILKEVADAVVIGQRSAGAGGITGSIELPFSSGKSYFIYTADDYYDLSGNRINGNGIQPDIEVKQTIEAIRAGKDEILDAAIGYCSGIE